jgi:hypothetical protein
MRWLLWSIVAIVGVVGTIGLIGYFLPVGHEASRSAEFTRPAADVFALIADLENYRAWWPEAEVKVAVVESVPSSRFVTKIVGETQFGGTWTWHIAATPRGSRATITERGEVYNPIFRTLSKFVFGHTATMESCLAAAQKKLGA